jgi:hypothetical protein
MLSAECVETFFSSITVALTLLLVFKTNSCVCVCVGGGGGVGDVPARLARMFLG